MSQPRRLRFRLETFLGRAALLAVLTVVLLAHVLRRLPVSQVERMPSIFFRYNSDASRESIEAVKKRRGLLVMGTSESEDEPHGNTYWHLLNLDREITEPVFVFSGAGRAPYVWLPFFLANPDVVKGLRVLLFINPTYWRRGLNNFHYEYFKRYNSYDLVRSARRAYEQRGLQRFLEPYLNERKIRMEQDNYPLLRLEAVLRGIAVSFLAPYTYDLPGFIEYLKGQPIAPNNQDLAQPSPAFLASLQTGLDLEMNASMNFLAEDELPSLPEIDTSSNFQLDALEAFVGVAQELGVELTVCIGPYNGILGQKTNPQVLKDYAQVISGIKTVLDRSNTHYVDASDLSFVPGVFLDAQHHSAYGGYLLERKIVGAFQAK